MACSLYWPPPFFLHVQKGRRRQTLSPRDFHRLSIYFILFRIQLVVLFDSNLHLSRHNNFFSINERIGKQILNVKSKITTTTIIIVIILKRRKNRSICIRRRFHLEKRKEGGGNVWPATYNDLHSVSSIIDRASLCIASPRGKESPRGECNGWYPRRISLTASKRPLLPLLTRPLRVGTEPPSPLSLSSLPPPLCVLDITGSTGSCNIFDGAKEGRWKSDWPVSILAFLLLEPAGYFLLPPSSPLLPSRRRITDGGRTETVGRDRSEKYGGRYGIEGLRFIAGVVSTRYILSASLLRESDKWADSILYFEGRRYDFFFFWILWNYGGFL